MIEKRGPNTWRVGFRTSTDDGRKWIRKTITFPPGLSESEQRDRAEIEDARLRVQYADGLIAPDTPMTVRQFADLWMRDHVRPNLAADTIKNYQFFLDSRILPALGDLQLSKLNPVVLNRFIVSLSKDQARTTAKPADQRARKADRERPAPVPHTLSERTVRHYYDTLSNMLDKAVQWEYIARNPMEKVDRPRVHKKRLRVLDDDQAVRLLRCLALEESLPFRCAVLLALLCGLRLSEVGALTLDDVDWNECTIDISRALHYTPETGSFYGNPKTETSSRVIDLPAGMMALLEETRHYHEEARAFLGDRWRGTGLIVSAWDGSPLHKDTPSKQWRKFADAHGFEGVRFHDLRHSHATILFASNLDAVAIATRLGHASADTTLRIYAHAVRKRDRESAEAMQALFTRAYSMPAPDQPQTEPQNQLDTPTTSSTPSQVNDTQPQPSPDCPQCPQSVPKVSPTNKTSSRIGICSAGI